MIKNLLYKILDVSPDATPEEIEAAYHRKQPYYDFFDPATDFEDDPEAKELYEAYAVLSDTQKRQEYDEIQRTHVRTIQDLSEEVLESTPPWGPRRSYLRQGRCRPGHRQDYNSTDTINTLFFLVFMIAMFLVLAKAGS